jgi:hypothetical protein
MEAIMPRYHFSLVDSIVITDQGGRVLDSEEQAILAAKKLAEELFVIRPDLHNRNYKVRVTDRDGQEIFLAPIDPAN